MRLTAGAKEEVREVTDEVASDEPPMKKIETTVTIEDDMRFLTSEDEKWRSIMITLWEDTFLNEVDRPVTFNKGGRLPLCTIYKTSMSLDRYIGMADLVGEEVMGRMTFGKFGTFDNALIWGLADPDRVMRLLNDYLKKQNVLVVCAKCSTLEQ